MTSAPGAASLKPGQNIDRGAWSWALFEWARNPWVLLGTIYVFAPYVSNVVIGDPIQGQTLISGWHKTAGIIIALTAPFLGAASDRMGRRKPLLALFVGVLALSIVVQWWALPGGQGLPLWALGLAVTVSGVAFVYTEVLHHSMLIRAAPAPVLSKVSGLGLSLGNAASVLLLVAILLTAPMLDGDPGAHTPERLVTLLCAAWLIVFAVPLFRYTPDLVSTGESFGNAVKHGIGNVIRTVRKLRDHRNVALFLIARMFYADGKTAILIFAGIYAAGTMSWGREELIAYGIILTIFAVCGGFVGAWLDGVIGPKRAVVLETATTLTCLIGMVSMSSTSMLFFVPVIPDTPVWGSPLFSTAPELAYMGFAIVIAISITAAYASSRALMARLAPQGMEGEVFGLYALAGSATAWLGPMLVEYFTDAYQSQRAGFGSLAMLLIVGFTLLLFVKPPPPAHAD